MVYYADAILAEAEITEEISENVRFFDDNGISIQKALARKRRHATRRSKTRLYRSAIEAYRNLRARLSDVNRYPNTPIRKIQAAQRLLQTARKMGMEI